MRRFIRIFAIAAVAAILFASAACAQSYEPIELTADARYAMNLFLSNFAETGVDEISVYSEDMVLVDFAHDHLWFNDYESFEYGEYSEYPDDGNNCRVSDDRIQEIVDKYFLNPPEVDLSQTRFNYDGEYYYHCETGGWINDGFAQAVSVCPLGEDRYFVSFMIFGGGEFWENDVLRMSIDEAAAKFGAPAGFGTAVIHTGDLSDRSAYKMIDFSR